MSPGGVPVVIVTGGAQGIGRGIVEHLLGQGVAVVAADIDTEAVRECAGRHAATGRFHALRTDVGDEGSVAAAVDAAPSKREKSMPRVAISNTSAFSQSASRMPASGASQTISTRCRSRTRSGSVMTAVNASAACSKACATVGPKPRTPTSAT